LTKTLRKFLALFVAYNLTIKEKQQSHNFELKKCVFGVSISPPEVISHLFYPISFFLGIKAARIVG